MRKSPISESSNCAGSIQAVGCAPSTSIRLAWRMACGPKRAPLRLVVPISSGMPAMEIAASRSRRPIPRNEGGTAKVGNSLAMTFRRFPTSCRPGSPGAVVTRTQDLRALTGAPCCASGPRGRPVRPPAAGTACAGRRTAPRRPAPCRCSRWRGRPAAPDIAGDDLGERDAVHGAGHDDVAEHQADPVVALQRAERVGRVLRAQRAVAELLDQRGGHLGDLGVVLDDEHGPLPRRDRMRLGRLSRPGLGCAWLRGR